MSTYFEIWLRGHAKNELRKMSTEETYHPHITLARPFKMLVDEEVLKNKVSLFCNNYQPIPFELEGKRNFNREFYHVPVTNANELLEFCNRLGKLLELNVIFNNPKPEKETHLHATVDIKEDILYCEKMEQYMLRLTCVKDKKILTSYDFVTGETLNRKESLSKLKWYNTVHRFTEKTGLLPTRQGYKK